MLVILGLVSNHVLLRVDVRNNDFDAPSAIAVRAVASSNTALGAP